MVGVERDFDAQVLAMNCPKLAKSAYRVCRRDRSDTLIFIAWLLFFKWSSVAPIGRWLHQLTALQGAPCWDLRGQRVPLPVVTSS